MKRLTAEEANRALAERYGVDYDPRRHRPSADDYGRATPLIEAPGARPSPHEERIAALAEARKGMEHEDDRPSAGRTGDGWRYFGARLTQSRTDMRPMAQERMQRIALKLWDSNPMAQRLVIRLVNYVMGEGVSVVAKHADDKAKAKIQEVIDATWNDHRNRMDSRVRRWFAGYLAFGELCLNTSVNKSSGLVRFASISPFQIVDVFTEQEDVDQIDFVAVGKQGLVTQPKLLKAIRVDEDGSVVRWMEAYEGAARTWQDEHGAAFERRARRQAEIDRLRENDSDDAQERLVVLLAEAAADYDPIPSVMEVLEESLSHLREDEDFGFGGGGGVTGSNYDPDLAGMFGLAPVEHIDGLDATSTKKHPRRSGKCFYWGANTLPGMVRGRSVLLPLADMIDAFDRLVWLSLERRALINAFVWDVELLGASQTTINEWYEQNPPPEPGSIRVHNEREKWNAVAPDLGSSEEAQAADNVLGYIATGAGFPKHWVGGADDPSKASAVEMTTPTMKDMTALQREFRAILDEMFRFVIDCAVGAGALPADTPSDCFEVQMPDLSVADTVKAASTFQAVMTAYLAMMQAQVVDVEETQKVYKLLATAFGHEVDLEELQKRLEDEAKKAKLEQDKMGAYGPNGPAMPPELAAAMGGGKPGEPGQPPPGGGNPLQRLAGLQRPTTPTFQDRKAGQGSAIGAGASRGPDRARLAALAAEFEELKKPVRPAAPNGAKPKSGGSR